MADVAIREGEGAPSPPLKIRPHWSRRLAGEVATLVVALLILLSIGLVALDTAPGHRWLVDRLQQIETQSGLRFRIGRIEGSIFSESRLRNVQVLDHDGVFLTSPEITLDWSPIAWLTNSLTIDRLEADRLRLERLPKLKPTGRKGPVLPKFDIHIGKLEIRRFEVASGVAGQARVGKLSGSADIRSGRAVVRLNGALVGGDRLLVNLDAEPDGNRFDLDIRGSAPANGLLPALFGSKRPLKLVVEGDGTWQKWRGRAVMDLAGKPTARVALGADNGRYQLNGQVAAEPFFKGKVLRLTAPLVTVRGTATFLQRQLDGELRLSSPSLRAVARGRVDLAQGAYRNVRLGLDLLRPPALFKNMTGQKVRLVWTLDGTFGRADYSYRLTSPNVKFDNTGFVNVRAEGRGRAGPWPMRVPMRMQARAVTGVGDVAGAILANVRIEGMLSLTPALVRGDNLALQSDKLSGKLSLLIDLKTGRFDIVISGGLTRYLIPGLGIVDVKSDLHVVPGPGGKARVLGRAQANVRRLDNSFFLGLTGSLPRLTTDLERTTDGILHFSNLQLYSRDLRLTGAGIRRRDGTFHIEARGKQAKYGPLRLILDGRIERPRLNIQLDHPNEAMGLTNVALLLDPTSSGFDYKASGNSRLGPFTSLGRILLPKGGRTIISIAALNVAGTTGHGDLRADPGGFTGLLALSGGGIDGTLAFSPVNDAQKIEAHLTASNARIPGGTLTAIRAGKLDGTILLEEGRTSLDGTAVGRGINYGAASLARLTVSGRLVNGSGRVRAALAGRRGQAFELVTLADVSPDQIKLTGRGQVGRRELVLESPAVLTRADGGWRIAPTRVRFAGGRATVSGSTGNHPELHAVVQAMPLELLDMLWPNLDLSGSANGKLDYSWRGAGGVPSGRADLRIRRLTRAGLVLSSKPIDVGLAAVLSGGKAAMRAVAVSDGKAIGRAQARFAPLAAGQPIVAALANAPMLLQLRYAGPADTLWRLSGVEVFDLSGPIAIGADINGRLVDPVIRGSLKTENARIESAVTGMVITGLNASGRFGGSRLVLDSIAGRTAGGSVSGTGTVNFSGGSPAFDLDFNVQKAQLLGRDDLAATVTGPISIHSSGRGGRISGQLHLDKGRFTLGKASASASVPQLQVRHVGRDEDEVIELDQLAPWNLDIKVSGRDLTVRGLGIDSLWRTNLSIGGTVAAPRLTGEANLDRGEYEFAGRSFRLEHGVIRFRGESPVNPLLDIRAEAQVQGLDASVNVRGTGLKPEITFASVPALPQDELLSRILFGTSITNLSAPEAVQLASAIAALQSGNGSLDPINAVRRAVGLDRLRIVPADIATGQKTAISAGKYLGRKLFVEVITDGQGYSATRVEYQVTRWLSVLSSISTIGRASANVRISKDY